MEHCPRLQSSEILFIPCTGTEDPYLLPSHQITPCPSSKCPGRFQQPMRPHKLQHLGSIPTPHAAGAPFTATLLRSSNCNMPGVAEDQLMHQRV